jgi:carboxypeptidase Taq
MSLYTKFVEKFRHIALLKQAEQLLQWDAETYMPAGSIEARSQQIACLAGLMHQEATSAAYRASLSEMVDIESGKVKIEGLTPLQQANIREWAKEFVQRTKLPKRFVETFYSTAATSTEVWKKAKKTADFELFKPWLQKMVDLNKEQANLLGYKDSPYDALLDLYEPGMKTSTLSTIFSDLAVFLTPFVQENKSLERPYQTYFDHSFPAEDQMKFNHWLLEALQVDPAHLRLDLSVHPYCKSIHVSDVRITTNLEGGLLQNIFAVLHETGHAFYELNLPVDWISPTSQIASMGIHESQSRWWEIMIGKSMPFWEYVYPTFQAHFPSLKTLPLTDFYKHINQIRPSYIRIYADEVTYPLHVILRYELEKALIEGSIQVADVPHLWNTKMKELLGITPENNALGCLQDIHWSMGAFGYFPTYALGDIYAAQYFTAFERDFPDWKTKVAAGSFAFVKTWLKHNIHQHGRMYSAAQSIELVSQKPLSLEPYKAYLTKNFGTGKILC